ncbi:aminotransferase class III-fold pyridoxal phosphate-dependent enzyme [Shimia marina]|uniref:Adenosylmethionine-8-amino-7-oxononanoate aminotransferase n=1 Tax=Shimia marina TaxID=321267 RepID=A0A0N7LRY0_9RHOB|nr:aminotransferase class III-fold pyridoxal phosphate-dependent enzyme [Shimia marina]CUH52076.1 Adenosylmethionine-8-amino-7-oxononanoate aminotransferase [Shimia marina]SFE63314.1 Adenosylmethionine-8-amino-7-oxononanoate aminotransferase [Shimia marina]
MAKDTNDILAQDAHLIQSFADLNALKQQGARTVISRAKGAYVYDSEGNELIDGIGGLWCVNIGHGNEEMVSAISNQLQTLDFYSTFYNFTHPAAAALAEKIAQLAPGHLNAVYFGNSGSVANDSAIRMLHHYNIRKGKPNKKLVLSRHGAYHGSTHLAMAMTTPGYSEGWHAASELVHHLRSPHHWREGGEMTEVEFLDALIDDLKQSIERIGAENICAFIAEPIQGAGGVVTAPAGYHKRAWEICQANDIKYVADEVVTAFGRLGHFFASEDVFGMVPDIITTAKGLTSGYQPLSATIVSDDIHEVISGPDGMFLHGMTYSGHPAAAAAGLTNIDIMEREGIPERVQTTGKQFENNLRGLMDIELVGEVRGSHFMMGIEFVKDRATKASHPAEAQVGLKVARACQKRGLIARPLGNVLILSPTLIMDAPMIDQIESTLRDAITEVAAGL